ncbi:MAG: glycosyltransferase [Opitutae bacterium]|nr:glycosyltransferase [Opitutae bacterium]
MNGELLLGGLALALWIGAAWDVMRGNRRLASLANVAAPAPAHWPRVSIVFAARNEAATVGAAVPTMLALDYPDLELVAVNDRSEDRTGEILDALATREPRLRVDYVRELPPGWLGKNHALHHGAQRATGEWILFTDADVHFRPDALRRAIAHAEARSLDHLAAAPQLHSSAGRGGHLLGICVGAFSLTFALFLRPWKIADPRSRAHGGVGAFNLVRASAYRARGGHAPLRLRPDDDIKLGKPMKSHGGRSEFALGAGAISVAWYASVGELVRGLTKNAFAGVDYRAWMILGGVAAHGLFFLWPVAALAWTSGTTWMVYAAAVALMLLVAVDNQRFGSGRRWHGLLFPLGLVVFDYILLRSMVVTLWQRGIVWRGTHYPLEALRRNNL